MSLAIGIGYGAAFLLLAVVIWRTDRKSKRRIAARQAAWIRSTLPPAKAALDTEPGFNLALQDECELIYGMPAYTGVDRLWDAIRDEQQKGEQA